MNRGVARCAIFESDADRVEFGRLLGLAHQRFGVTVHAYCLMGNHYHLVVECPEGGLTEAMHLIGSVYVRHANERMGRDGPLFRDRFYAKQVVDDAYLIRLIRYVHRNPLAFLGPERLVTYRWSSLRTYLGFRRAPEWMRLDQVIAIFGGLDAFRSVMMGADLGRVAVPRASAATCLAAIDMVVDEHCGGAPHQRLARTVAMLMLDRVEGPTATALLADLDYATPAALSSARSRAKRRLAEEPQLSLIADEVERFLR